MRTIRFIFQMAKPRIPTILRLYFLFVAVDSAVYISDLSMSRMIELMAKRPFCKLHTDRGDIQRMLLAADQKRVRHVPLENVLALEKVCQEAGGLQGELQGGLGFIYPGTKWCGPGSKRNVSTFFHNINNQSIRKKADIVITIVIVVNLIIKSI